MTFVRSPRVIELLLSVLLLCVTGVVCQEDRNANLKDIALNTGTQVEWFDDTSVLTGRSTLDAGPNCTTWNADNRLECWLFQLQVPIPNEKFSKDWITISIEDMVCSQFALHAITPDYQPPHSISLSVASLQATCKGKYKATGGLSGHVQASVTQATKDTVVLESQGHPPALQLSFRISPDSSTQFSFHLPDSLTTTDCQTHLQAANIHFTGSTSARLIQLFSKTIGHYITQALKGQLCPLLPEQLDPLATHYLHVVDNLMKPYLPKKELQNHEAVTTTATSELPKSRLRRLSSTQVVDDKVLLDSPSNDTIPSNPVESKLVHWGLGILNDQLRDHLQDGWFLNSNNTKNCPEKCRNTFRGLSGWLRTLIGEKLAIPLPLMVHNISLPPLPLNATGSINLQRITVQGLDLLETLQLGRPFLMDDNSTALSSQVTTDNDLVMEADILVHIQMGNSSHALDEPFTVHVNITQLEMLLSTSLQVIDWERTSLLQVVTAVQKFVEDPSPSNIRTALGCLIRTIDLVDNTSWDTDLVLESISLSRRTAHISNNTQDASLEEDLDALVNTVIKLFLTEYSALWQALIHGLSQDPARNSVNHLLTDWLHQHSTEESCPAVPTGTDPRWLNFTKFIALDQFNSFLNRSATIRSLNRYMECVGDFFEGLPLLASPITGDIIQVKKLETKNWNALQEVQLLKPSSDTSLESWIKWGKPGRIPQMDLTLAIETVEVSGQVNLTLFAGFEAQAGIQMDYDLNRFQNLTVAHLLQQGQCAILPMIELQVMPKNVTSVDLGNRLGLNVSALLNNQTIKFSTDKNVSQDLPQLASQVLDWSVESLRSLVNEALGSWVRQNSEICPGVVPMDHDQDDNDNDDKKKKADKTNWLDYPMMWVFLVFVVLAQGGVVSVVKGPDELQSAALGGTHSGARAYSLTTPLLENSRINDDDEDALLDPAPLEEDIAGMSAIQDSHQLDQDVLNDIRSDLQDEDSGFVLEEHSFQIDGRIEEKALLGSPRISEEVQFGLPILVVGTMVLLFASNVSVGASVNLFVNVKDLSIPIPGLFHFSLGNTIVELYKAGIYPLLFLVVVFSGIWPYAKLIWMLQLWLSPFWDQHKREERLLTLDALSKFSLVDTYVLVVMLVAFRFHLELAQDLGIEVYVTPQFGFYAFLLATCLSLLLGHGMLFFHRRAQLSGLPDIVPVEEIIEKESIFDHFYGVSRGGPKRRLSRFIQLCLLVAALSAFGFLVIGFGQKSFTFAFGGLAGLALGDKSEKSYSLISLGAAIPQGVPNPNSVAIRSLQFAYYFYAAITPLTCLGLLLTLFLCPTTLRVQRRLLVAAEIANAWGAVEVFLLSIVAALFQISTFASFIIGDKCDLINRIAASLGEDILPQSDAICFEVTASVSSSSWYLVAGVVLNSIVVSTGLRFAHVAIDERSYQSRIISSEATTIAQRMYRFPLLGSICFGSGDNAHGIETSGEEEGANGDDEEESEAEWQHWF